jgi:phage N-6-adenine-methyltransferase
MLPEDDVRETPPVLFATLNARFAYDLDVCATTANAKCPRFFSESDDGLAQTWAGARAWCNPPFSAIPAWVAKAWRECAGTECITLLVPATRTEQPWWQRLIEPWRDGRGELVAGVRLTSEFLPRRPRFLKDGVPLGSPKFGCVLLHWSKK